MQNAGHRQALPGSRRIRTGPRTQLACINCKERKLKCDSQIPTCVNCQRFDITCLVEDPATRRHQPRNYVETLEAKVAFLEDLLRKARQGNTAPPVAASGTEDTPSGSSPEVSETKDDDDDEASALSSKVALLGMTADGEARHYLGPSSIFSFSHVIHASLRQPFSGNHLESLNDYQDDPAAPPSPCFLPDYELGISLSNAYFENIHPHYPFLHEPTFRRWEDALVRPSNTIEELDFDSAPLFFVNMVPMPSTPTPDVMAKRSRFTLSEPCWYLTQDHCRRKLSGIALRQCIELGYHRSVNPFGSKTGTLQLEMRKRAFWCTFGIDCYAATILGRPLGIPLQEVDAEFPLDIDDSNIAETDILVEPRSPNSAFSTTMSTALHVFRLRKIWARLHASLYSDMYNMDNTTHDDRIPLFRAEIDTWLASTPPIPPRTGAALSILATQDWYDLSHSETIIMLYRGRLIDHLGGASDDVFLQCARAAESICLKNRRLYVAKPVNCTWGTLHVIFSAGLTYLHCLWTSAAVRHRTSLNEMSSTLTSCMMVLAVIAERFKGAAPYRDIFEALCTRTKKMMVDGGGEQSGVQISTLDPCYVMPGMFTQWMAEISDAGISDTVDSLLAGLVSDCVTYEGFGELT
ncbi:hypothetical protein H9Q74_005673 [Fusarium xylarioides]|nr:hypothetical protein H9Q71_006305 [Fusarium xylarioides]KAG5824216.1 hypothetical protein H9Q74_005673 [Fusarium xylarioides]